MTFVEFDIQKPYSMGRYYINYWGYANSKDEVLDKAKKEREKWQKYFDELEEEDYA